MGKTPHFLLLCTLVIAGAAGAASAPKGGAHGEGTVAPALIKCGEHGEQAFARLLTGEWLIRAAAVRADEPIGSHSPAPDPRDTGLETFARCRIWDGGILAAAGGTRT
jgi:hypothetical protein